MTCDTSVNLLDKVAPAICWTKPMIGFAIVAGITHLLLMSGRSVRTGRMSGSESKPS